MTFYNEISKYYEHIFPQGDKQLKFIKEEIGRAPKRLLDVACGNGVYSVALAQEGYEVTAIDSSQNMIEATISKAELEAVSIEALNCNMREMTKQLKPFYEGIFCIGNSLVHLDTLQEVEDALKQMYTLLKPEGTLILQLMNYNNILENKVTQLPPIHKDEIDLDFARYYTFDEINDKIIFRTVLTVENKTIENTVELLPLKSEEILETLEASGFKVKNIYGDFDKANYKVNESYHTIIVAKK